MFFDLWVHWKQSDWIPFQFKWTKANKKYMIHHLLPPVIFARRIKTDKGNALGVRRRKYRLTYMWNLQKDTTSFPLPFSSVTAAQRSKNSSLFLGSKQKLPGRTRSSDTAWDAATEERRGTGVGLSWGKRRRDWTRWMKPACTWRSWRDFSWCSPPWETWSSYRTTSASTWAWARWVRR